MEEWWSILAALVGAGATTFFLWQVPDFRPSSDLAWVVKFNPVDQLDRQPLNATEIR
jgi:hypothetical protein